MLYRFTRGAVVVVVVAAAGLSFSFPGRAQSGKRPVTVDDLMTLRAMVDARISPDGSRVAFVTSTPNVAQNSHDGALFLVASTGGTPKRLGESVQMFNVPSPAPRLRWAPDGSAVSMLGLVSGRPQVFAIPIDGSAARQLTAAPEGVFGYEWSPDGSRLAYLTRDPMPEAEARQRQNRSFVIRADAPDLPTRLAVIDLPAAPSTQHPAPSGRGS